MSFLNDDNEFDVDGFRHAVRIMITAQEILVSPSDYPTETIGNNARRFRQLGLGYTNLGALLMAFGLAYDSDDAGVNAANKNKRKAKLGQMPMEQRHGLF